MSRTALSGGESELATQYPSFIYTEQGFRLDESVLGEDVKAEYMRTWSSERSYVELYYMGLDGEKREFHPSLAFLVRVAEFFFDCLTRLPELELVREEVVVEIDEEVAARLADTVPFVIGMEYISKEWMQGIFNGLRAVFAREIVKYSGKVVSYLAERSPRLHMAERIFFHLVENENSAHPFAFIATYATKTEGGVKHMPLAYALTEFKDDRVKLIELLSCLNKVAEVSDLISSFMENGELFHPLKLTADEAYQFLKQIEDIEALGVLCRIPNWWRRRSAAVTKTIKLGDEEPSKIGLNALISLRPTLTVDGVELAEADIENILRQSEGLAFLKGKWVEVDHDKLRRLLAEMEEDGGDITLLEALRKGTGVGKETGELASVTNGKWLSSLYEKLRNPAGIKRVKPPKTLKAELRGYQQNGYNWLNYMSELGFGACLADDMGLGKTLQVLSFLENRRLDAKAERVLLLVPASLLGNWEKEIQKFVPEMAYHILHGRRASVLGEELLNHPVFLTITTYGMAARIKELEGIEWDVIILDEAQAIKNPVAKQTKEIKKLSSRMQIAMTGTPIENDLTNLWSLFDFLNKGLLGSFAEFKRFCKNLRDEPQNYLNLKNMIAPFLLRRMKTDKAIISDLPDKIEKMNYAGLSKKQTVLYTKIVRDLEEKLSRTEGMERRGLVLATIMKLKQVCNHPSQYLGLADYPEEESGKFQLLRELCELIYEKRERVLVFTQFRELTGVLSSFLSIIFRSEGLVLHGSTSVKERNSMVEAFQGEAYVPYIILSLKAGGTGLNLTKASHVIHFDRWWNPAVENQATDRAFRIGQDKNVMVHKFLCKDTIEEKINDIIESKKALAGELIDGAENKWITEMSNEEILRLLRLE